MTRRLMELVRRIGRDQGAFTPCAACGSAIRLDDVVVRVHGRAYHERCVRPKFRK